MPPSNGPEPQQNDERIRGSLWEQALLAARGGDVAGAREICGRVKQASPAFPGAHEYLLGRCLAEAGEDLDEAVDLLLRVYEVDQRNTSTGFILALAHMRAGRHEEASRWLSAKALPHDEDLLTQIALSLEMSLRDWPENLPEGWPPWPLQLGPDPASVPSPLDEASAPLVIGAPSMTRRQKFELGRLLNELERLYKDHRLADLLRRVGVALGTGLDDAELQLLAGVAGEEGGDAVRARAHLSLALAMEPKQAIARTFLGRVYWRNGWNELAEDLWRSLPVEGPEDYGRHYHLALAYASTGRPTEARKAMQTALHDFYIETREFFIERVFWRWREKYPPRSELEPERQFDFGKTR